MNNLYHATYEGLEKKVGFYFPRAKHDRYERPVRPILEAVQ